MEERGNEIANCDVCRSHHEHHHSHHGGGCNSECGFGFACYHHRYLLVRWIIGLVILGIVFMVGVKIGEFAGLVGGGDGDYYGGRSMMGYYGSPARGMMLWGGNAGYGPQMMSGWNTTDNASGAQSAPSGKTR